MEKSLESLIKAQIRTAGPMDVGAYMALALGHPVHGYYMGRDVLGRMGDFITAPEISQMFGELIGLWLADALMRAGMERVHIVELGPGRGTLMADLLRATRNVPAMAEAQVHLVETSPALRAKQAELLREYTPQWHDNVDTLPDDAPLLIVANEFFDALPMRQAVMTKHGWCERCVGLGRDGELVFCLGGPAPTPALKNAPEGAIREFAPVRAEVMSHLAARIGKQGGVMLVVDYGYEAPQALGDTLQGMRAHSYCDVLAHIGQADITSHVDFATLAEAAKGHCNVLPCRTQKAFLEGMGIDVRARQLNNPTSLQEAVRLCDAQGMGTLFKVMGFYASPCDPAWI